ncbi:alpha-galactosidase [Tessaracoccus sp.]
MHTTARSIVMRNDGVSLVLDISSGRLPSVLHWGDDLGTLSEDDVAVLALGSTKPAGLNQVDKPVRVAMLAEQWTGWMGRPGLRGSRQGQAWSPRFTTYSIEVDGLPHPGGVVEMGAGVVHVRARDDVSELALSQTIELLHGGAIRTRARLTNRGSAAYQLEGLDLVLPVPPVADELLDFGGRWARERVPQRHDFTLGTHLRENRKGRTGADSAYLLHAGVPGFGFSSGEVWAVHTAWSGNHIHHAEKLSSGEQVIGGGELLLPGEVILHTDESYESPWLYGSWGDGLDAVARRFHTWLRSRDVHPTSPRPVTLNVWEAVYFDHSAAPLFELAELAASIGVERFVLDDGWFSSRRDEHSGLGDWWVSDAAWPDGLGPLADKVTGLGMQLGLWFEPEMVNPDSDTARAHPEWIMAANPARWPVESRHQQVLNLGIPACYDHVRDAIVALLSEYDITYIKWDHNRDLVEAGDQRTGRPGVRAQTLAFYRLLDELRHAFPSLEIESCSSGGARIDLEVLQRTDRVWTSDCIDPQERQLIHRWTTQLIPPELMGAHIASDVSHTTGRSHTLGFRAASALFGHLGIEWDLRQATEEQRRELRTWVAFHKEHRALLHDGDMVRLDFPDESLIGHGVIAHDKRCALYSLASVGRSTASTLGRIRLPGLEPTRRYQVRPAAVAGSLNGLIPPPWWGEPSVTGLGTDDAQPDAGIGDFPGIEATGHMLATVGLTHPAVSPEQVVLYWVEGSATTPPTP